MTTTVHDIEEPRPAPAPTRGTLHHKRPTIPDGVALPERLRPVIERYDAAVEAFVDARDALTSAEQGAARAFAADQQARERAIEAGEDPPDALEHQDALRRLVAEREVDARARLAIADRTGAEVTRALRRCAGELRATAVATFYAARAQAADLVNGAEAAIEQVHAALIGLDQLDRLITAPMVPADVVMTDDRSIIGAPETPDGRVVLTRAAGQWLRPVVEGAADELRRRGLGFRFDGPRSWLLDQPWSLDQNVAAYLDPILAAAAGDQEAGTDDEPE